jgi:hypothetical protein
MVAEEKKPKGGLLKLSFLSSSRSEDSYSTTKTLLQLLPLDFTLEHNGSYTHSSIPRTTIQA